MIGFWLGATAALAVDLVDFWSLEEDDGGLVAGGEIGTWEWGEVQSGPESGFIGTRGWATNLEGNYGNDSVETLTFPGRDLVALSQPAVCWMQWLDLEMGDAGSIEWWDGTDHVLAEPIYGYPSGNSFEGYTGAWEEVCVNLSGAGDLADFRLVFAADAVVNATGWVVDEFSLFDGDPVGPLLSNLSILADTEDLDGPYLVTVTAVDNVDLDVVRLGWQVNGVDQTAVLMTPTAIPDQWMGQLPGQDHGADVDYWIDASDGQNWSRLPQSGAVSFAVRLPAPTGLEGPEGRVVATQADLNWTAPESSHTLESYRVYRQDALLVEATTPTVSVDLVGEGEDTFVVSAAYDVGESDPSDPITLDSHVPKVSELVPDEAYQGDHIRVEIIGVNLLFVQGDLVVDLGGGLEVEEIDVVDVNLARLLVAVSKNASPGMRAVDVISGDVVVSLDDAFEVVDGAELPHLESVEPTFVTQGTEAELLIQASAPFADLPQVTLGEGVVVSQVAWVADGQLRLQLAIEPDAPLGEHDLEVDDGERIYGGLTVQVRDDPPATTSCSTHPGSLGSWGAWVVVLAGTLRRRD